MLVLPETVVRWHRAGFQLYWTLLCKVRRRVGGDRRISKQIRELISSRWSRRIPVGLPRVSMANFSCCASKYPKSLCPAGWGAHPEILGPQGDG